MVEMVTDMRRGGVLFTGNPAVQNAAARALLTHMITKDPLHPSREARDALLAIEAAVGMLVEADMRASTLEFATRMVQAMRAQVDAREAPAVADAYQQVDAALEQATAELRTITSGEVELNPQPAVSFEDQVIVRMLQANGLSTVYEDEACFMWALSRNTNLHGWRPADAVKQGRLMAVLAEIDSMQGMVAT